MITRTASLRGYGKFERIGLTSEEIDKVMEKLLEHNFNELQRIAKYLKEKGYVEKSTEALEMTMRTLAEKQLTSSFTVIVNALDEKIFKLRSEARKSIPTKVQEKVKTQVEKGFKKKDTEEGKSMITEAFERTKE